MAISSGFVQRATWTASLVCAWIGPSLQAAEVLFLEFGATDTDADRGFKRSAAALLARAQLAGYRVAVTHLDGSAVIEQVSLAAFDICPVGPAIHGDFYSVTGRDIPLGTQVVFDSPAATVAITPDLVRPHWVLIASLPTSIPVGRNTVRLQSPSWTSQSVPVDVAGGQLHPVRALCPGAPKARPFNIVFVGNPAILTEANTFVADPVLTNRTDFQGVVTYCLRMLLTTAEDVLTQGGIDAQFRVVSIFDPTQRPSDANALAHEIAPNLMEPRRGKLNGFLAGYAESADLVLVITGSTTHDRATAWFTSDDAAQPGVGYTYDGTARTHGRFAAIPGSAVMPLNMDQWGVTPLHEVGHAASDFVNGMIIDLYDDVVYGFPVNKKARSASSDAVPAHFGSYDGTNYASDQNRDGLGYQAGWTSYHPEPIDATRPNVMDNFWRVSDDPQRCRFDSLTHAWFVDRLRAKLTR